MKKIAIVLSMFIFSGCGNSSDNNTSTGNSDSAGYTSPSPGDTLKSPSGVDNSSVISTDTAATNAKNSIDKLDSAKQKK